MPFMKEYSPFATSFGLSSIRKTLEGQFYIQKVYNMAFFVIVNRIQESFLWLVLDKCGIKAMLF